MEYANVEEFQKWMLAQKGRGFPDPDGLPFQRGFEAGIAAVAAGWKDVTVIGRRDGGAVVTMYRERLGHEPLEVELTIDADGDGVVADKTHGLTVVWNGPTMTNLSDVLSGFLGKSVAVDQK